MKDHIKVVINEVTYLLNRIHHISSPLSYDIYFEHKQKTVVFKVSLHEDKRWYLHEQSLPKVVYEAIPLLISVIERREANFLN